MEPGLWKRVVRNPNMVVGTEVDSVVVLGDPQEIRVYGGYAAGWLCLRSYKEEDAEAAHATGGGRADEGCLQK